MLISFLVVSPHPYYVGQWHTNKDLKYPREDNIHNPLLALIYGKATRLKGVAFNSCREM